jgi:transcriptional regulator with XRE-family HTH domain
VVTQGITDPEHWKTFGRWLRARRMATQRPRKELARIAGISDNSWSNYERGGRNVAGGSAWIVQRPTPETLMKLSKALQIPPKEMFAKAKMKAPWPLPDEPESIHPPSMFTSTTGEGLALLAEMTRGAGSNPAALLEILVQQQAKLTELSEKLEQLQQAEAERSEEESVAPAGRGRRRR